MPLQAALAAAGAVAAGAASAVASRIRCPPGTELEAAPPFSAVFVLFSQVAEWLLEQALVHQRRTLHAGTPGDNITIMVVSLQWTASKGERAQAAARALRCRLLSSVETRRSHRHM